MMARSLWLDWTDRVLVLTGTTALAVQCGRPAASTNFNILSLFNTICKNLVEQQGLRTMIVVFLEIVNLTTTSRKSMHNHSCSYSLMGLPGRSKRLYYQYYTTLSVVLDVESRATPNNAWDFSLQ